MQTKWIKIGKILIIALSFYSAKVIHDTRTNPEPVVKQTGRFESASKGIDWLIEVQLESGAWLTKGTHSDTVNALATLALLNAPEPVDTESREQALSSLKKSLESQMSDSNQYFVYYALSEHQKHKPERELKRLLESVDLPIGTDLFSASKHTKLFKDFRKSMAHRSSDELKSLWVSQKEEGFWKSGSHWSAELGDVYETALSVLVQVPKE